MGKMQDVLDTDCAKTCSPCVKLQYGVTDSLKMKKEEEGEGEGEGEEEDVVDVCMRFDFRYPPSHYS